MAKRAAVGTNADIQRAVNLREMGLNSGAVGDKLGRARQTIEGWYRKADKEGITANQAALDSEFEMERIGFQTEIRDLKAQLKGVHRDNLTSEVVRKKIIGIAEQTPEPPKWLSKTPPHDDFEGIPLTIWSDWHWGEVVDPAAVESINKYDMAVAQKRARALVEKTIYLCQRLEKTYPGIVVCLGGDMISGDIHDELSESNELPTMPIMLDLFGVLIECLSKLADNFGKVFVPCVAGNHGRNTTKPRFKNHNYSNFDWLLYCLLEKHFARDKRVQFYIPDGLDASFAVYGHRFMLTHGHMLGTAGGDGIIGAIGPIMRGDFKTRRSNEAVGMPYDTLLIGHYHQYIPLDRIVVNGSLKGYCEYAKYKLRATPEPPRQALLFVHPEQGITSQRPINLELPKKEIVREWVTWPEK